MLSRTVACIARIHVNIAMLRSKRTLLECLIEGTRASSLQITAASVALREIPPSADSGDDQPPLL